MKNKVKIILFLITILLIFPFAAKEVYAKIWAKDLL